MTTLTADSTTASADPVAAYRTAERDVYAALGLAPRERVLRLGGATPSLRVVDVGAGPPTLHVHGGGAWGALHAPLAAALPGRRHFLVDRPGFGLSERAAVFPDFRARSVAMLVAALDALELDCVDFVGNSIGAAMGLWLALAHPERVRSLALVGGVAMVGETKAPLILRLLGTPVVGPAMIKMETPSEQQVRTLWQRFGHDPARVHPTIHALALAGERVPSFARAWFECLAATLTLGGTRPGLEIANQELPSVRCPIAFAWGAQDPMVNVEIGRAVAARIPHARFTVVGAGHAPWLDDAGGVARAIEPVLALRA